MSVNKSLQAVLAPQVTEKATMVADKYNQITKKEVKEAIELMFKVEVTAVNILNMNGKTKRAGRLMGKRNDWKKAYISLKAGQEINFTGE
jgi:large subunit ribosomal protein L23